MVFFWILLGTHWKDMEPASSVQRVGLWSLSFLKSCLAWLWYCWRSRPNWADGEHEADRWPRGSLASHTGNYVWISGNKEFYVAQANVAAEETSMTEKFHKTDKKKKATAQQSRFHIICKSKVESVREINSWQKTLLRDSFMLQLRLKRQFSFFFVVRIWTVSISCAWLTQANDTLFTASQTHVWRGSTERRDKNKPFHFPSGEQTRERRERR